MKMTNEKDRVEVAKEVKDKTIVVGSEYDFWFNEEDDIYDELYGSETGGRMDR